MSETSANKAWQKIFSKYKIIDEIKSDSTFKIKANQIKEFKEPRLMAKWDTYESLPKIFKDNNINILPVSRKEYVLGDFKLYQSINEILNQPKKIKYMSLPYFETLNAENINSESMAIRAISISNILNDFLNTKNFTETFNGRMGTGEFKFEVEGFDRKTKRISVQNAQCEIDGGFENDESVVILEAKNISIDDFNIRQLYYPYRLWSERVHKPIRLIFMLYSNLIYHLFEYKFEEKENLSSIKLLNQKNYSLQETEISIQDIKIIRDQTKIETDDDQNQTDIPFIQADSMERIISLLEKLYESPLTSQQIAEFMNFDKRQADYYFNAGRYLELFQKKNDEDRNPVIELTATGEKIFRMTYKQRQLNLIKQMLKHKIFMEFFDKAFSIGEIATTIEIKSRMLELNVCSENLLTRRASSVRSWLRWIFNLVEI